ncbi:MAG: molybdopterin molybdotransferase MoeA [Spirochaetia bacterium]|nr:molybdopterin molybdotransferase MoeA [Spirochaetia bacterium]
MKKKHDATLRDFSEIFELTLNRAAERAKFSAQGQGQEPQTRTHAQAVEAVEVGKSCGRVLAEDVLSDRNLPPYDRVAVDGYACRKSDLPGPLRLIGTSSAGDAALHSVEEGSCVKVMTGGVLPEGADTVIMVEQSKEYPKDAAEMYVRYTGSDPGFHPPNFSPRGEDVPLGTRVVTQGTLLGPQHTALLASVGYGSVSVYALPKVGLLSTGNEVVEPGQKPEPHQIRNANAPQAVAQLSRMEIIPTYYGIVPDDPQALESTLAKAQSENDLILMSGGVSMGDFDFGPEAIERNGFTIQYDRVAVKPGRPTTFAVSDKADLFGLAGNPVSCFVIFEILVKPYLYRLMHGIYRAPRSFATLAQEFNRRNSERDEWIPVTIDEQGQITLLEYHGSAHFHSISRAEGLIKIERGIEHLDKGALRAVRLF